MAIINPPSFMQGRNDHSAQTDRLAESGLLLPSGAGNTWKTGVRGYSDLKVNPQGTPNMSVRVEAGQAFVPVSSSLQGTYHVVNDAATTLNIAASHATLNRIDRVILRVADAAISGSTNAASLEVVQGTAAASPSVPFAADSFIELARVAVNAGVTSIPASSITDVRRQTAALGGILTVENNTVRSELSPTPGMTIWNNQAARLEIWDGAAWVPSTGEDTGWVPITYDAAFTEFDNAMNAVRVRRIRNAVYMRGLIKPVTGSFTTTEVSVATIPAGFRPSHSIYTVNITNTTNIARLLITSSGDLRVNCAATSSYVSMNNLSWLTD